jgi:hypothetical protein
MHAYLSRQLSPPLANLLTLLWYTLLVMGILICYQRNAAGFVYLDL